VSVGAEAEHFRGPASDVPVEITYPRKRAAATFGKSTQGGQVVLLGIRAGSDDRNADRRTGIGHAESAGARSDRSGREGPLNRLNSTPTLASIAEDRAASTDAAPPLTMCGPVPSMAALIAAPA
jgi:hypothetical protein